jgi:colanic acid/amylovoran biosynthesis glycosyltransferase
MNKLVLITSEFPFGKGETFIENELPYLEEAFEHVTIISLSPDVLQTRKLGDNTIVIRNPIELSNLDKIASTRWLLNPMVIHELYRMCIVYRLFPNPARIFTVLFSWERARRLKNFLKPHICADSVAYAYWTDDSALALAQLKMAHLLNTTISRCHRWDIYFEESTINYLPFRSLIYNKLSSLVSISEDGLNYIKNKWVLTDYDKLKLSRLGTIDGYFKKVHVNFHLVSCSNVIPVKRLDLIAEALNLITEISIQWTHFGDGPLLDQVLQLCSDKASKHKIEFKGRRSNKEVKHYLKTEDVSIFINVSSSEGIPVSIMEAMSFGIPVVATNVGGNAEIVNEQNGWLLPKDIDPMYVKNLLLSVFLLKQSEISIKGENAFKTWQEKYNAESNYRDFVHFLKYNTLY